jgi:hypothetical protein
MYLLFPLDEDIDATTTYEAKTTTSVQPSQGEPVIRHRERAASPYTIR